MVSTGPARAWLPGSRTLLLLLAGSLLAASVMWALSRGLEHFFLVLLVLAIVGPTALILIVLSIPWSRRAPGSSGSSLPRFATGSLILIFAQLPATILGMSIEHWQVARAKRWGVTLVPRIEEWRARHERYPKDLAELGLELDPPHFCRSRLSYVPRADGFILDVHESGFGGHAFDSREGIWFDHD